jgi:hypothetical protein
MRVAGRWWGSAFKIGASRAFTASSFWNHVCTGKSCGRHMPGLGAPGQSVSHTRFHPIIGQSGGHHPPTMHLWETCLTVGRYSQHKIDSCIMDMHDQRRVGETHWWASPARTTANRRALTPKARTAVVRVSMIEPPLRPCALALLHPSRLCTSAIGALRALCESSSSPGSLSVERLAILQSPEERTGRSHA